MQNAMKVTPLYPQTPVTPNNDERQAELSNSLSSSTTRVRAHARERAEIEQYYCDTFGAPKAPPVAIREIDFALEHGLEPALIMTAMDEAAMAPRPSWAYARAIIRRLLGEGVLTPDAYAQRQARWQARRSQDREMPF